MSLSTVLDVALSAGVTVLLQSTVILGAALLIARRLGRDSSLRYPVLLSALGITVLAAGWAVWNPVQAKGIVVAGAAAAPGVAETPSGTGPARTEISGGLSAHSPARLPIAAGPTPEPAADAQRVEILPATAGAVAGPVRGRPLPWRGIGAALLGVWCVGSGVLLIRLVIGLRTVRRLVRSATELPDADAGQIWDRVVRDLGVRLGSRPPILFSSVLASPVVAGALRPRLLVPVSMEGDLGKDHFRAVLAHEMAHIVRRDPLVGLAERCIQVMLWPQPLLALCLRTLDRSREEICDNYALAVSDRQSYGGLLFALSEASAAAAPHPRRVAAMGLLQGGWSLEERVSDLLNPNRNMKTKAPLRHWITPSAGILVIAVLLGGTRITIASPEGEPEDRAERRESRESRGAEEFEARIRELNAAIREASERGQEDRAHQLEIKREELRAHRERERRAGEERRERPEGERFEAEVRELRGAIREAAERGQEDRAHQLEIRLRELRAQHERGERERGGGERAERRGRERPEGERFEAQVRELRAAVREAAERGQEDRAHQLEIRLRELFAHHERERERGGDERAERRERERPEGERFEAQVRELRAAVQEAAERGQEDRAHQLELRLQELLAHREHGERERAERRERERERPGGEQLEAQVRELRGAIREAAERGQEDRAHQLELHLQELLAHHEREGHGAERQGRTAQLERRLEEMARHVEEMQRAMQEMRRELERLRASGN